jgi:hypothetical protein
MQFADRTLGVEETQRMARALASDPDLRARLEAFMTTGPGLGVPFGEVLKAPVPPRLVDAIMSAGRSSDRSTPAPSGARPDPVGSIKTLFDSLFSFGRPRWAPAFAAALLVAGGAVGWQLQHVAHAPSDGQLRVDNGRITAQGVLAQALEKAAAGDLTKDDGQGLSVKVRLTFKSKAQAYCRQYDIERGGNAFAGVACRAPDGLWQVQYHAPTAAPVSGDGRTVPVSDAKAQLGALIDAMSGGDPLDRDDETRARAQQWR